MRSPRINRLSQLNPFLSTVFAVALLCQLAMPFTQAFATMLSSGASGSSQNTAICTPNGMITRLINPDTNQPVSPNALPKACEFCQICTLGSQDAGPSASAQTIAFLSPAPVISFNSDTPTQHQQIRLKGLRPVRAPPVLI